MTSPVVRSNPSADLVDAGDGVLRLEFHSKMNTVDDGTIAMMREAVDVAARGFAALVIGNDAEHFSAGLNLKHLLAAAEAGRWQAIESTLRAFQDANMAVKTSAVPVVAAVTGLALGGGCEICLHADRIQAAESTRMGLVELAVGLIPAAGGSKEMALRSMEPSAEPSPEERFDSMMRAEVSATATDARRLGYLRDADGVTADRGRLGADAKAAALARAASARTPGRPRHGLPAAGADGLARLMPRIEEAHRAGRATAYDATVARKLALVLCGGDVPAGTLVSEQHFLDLEREAFMSLCGEERTLERIRYTLATGKALRN